MHDQYQYTTIQYRLYICRIIGAGSVCCTAVLLMENVRNLASHDKGNSDLNRKLREVFTEVLSRVDTPCTSNPVYGEFKGI